MSLRWWRQWLAQGRVASETRDSIPFVFSRSLKLHNELCWPAGDLPGEGIVQFLTCLLTWINTTYLENNCMLLALGPMHSTQLMHHNASYSHSIRYGGNKIICPKQSCWKMLCLSKSSRNIVLTSRLQCCAHSNKRLCYFITEVALHSSGRTMDSPFSFRLRGASIALLSYVMGETVSYYRLSLSVQESF